ncbi:MAG: hypothetical protein WCJ45_03895 [bacterium]
MAGSLDKEFKFIRLPSEIREKITSCFVGVRIDSHDLDSEHRHHLGELFSFDTII